MSCHWFFVCFSERARLIRRCYHQISWKINHLVNILCRLLIVNTGDELSQESVLKEASILLDMGRKTEALALTKSLSPAGCKFKSTELSLFLCEINIAVYPEVSVCVCTCMRVCLHSWTLPDSCYNYRGTTYTHCTDKLIDQFACTDSMWWEVTMCSTHRCCLPLHRMFRWGNLPAPNLVYKNSFYRFWQRLSHVLHFWSHLLLNPYTSVISEWSTSLLSIWLNSTFPLDSLATRFEIPSNQVRTP